MLSSGLLGNKHLEKVSGISAFLETNSIFFASYKYITISTSSNQWLYF
jgi:hypothetical protein